MLTLENMLNVHTINLDKAVLDNQICFQLIDIIFPEIISLSSRYLLIMMSMCYFNVRCVDIDVNESVVIRANNKNVHPHLSCYRHIN